MSEKKIPWGVIGYPTYKRTYSRTLKEGQSHPTEEYPDTVDRILKGCKKQLKLKLSEKEEKELREIFLNLKGTVAGRFMWQLNTKTVKKYGLASLQNCAFTVIDHPIRPFTWAMDMLMLGSGVGYNLQREYVYKLPKLQKKKVKIIRKNENDADFIVPDTREGWVKLLGKILKAYFYSGKGFSYSTHCIRSSGVPIKGFGGVSSGPEVLVTGMNNICSVLDKRIGKQMRPIDCLDVMNIIGSIVVAGNIRRSAQVAIGDYDDLQFLTAKMWESGDIPNWRAMSNNSVVCNNINDLPPQFWEGYNGNGEPYGLLNLKLAQSMGRLGETQYPDPDVLGGNPCFTGETKLLTSNGYKTFRELAENEEVELMNYKGEIHSGKVWSNGVRNIISLENSKKEKIYCTPDHKFMSIEGEEIKAKDMIGKKIMPFLGVRETNDHKDLIVAKSPTILKIQDEGSAEVFDFTLYDDTHWGVIGGGYIAHNCMEQMLAPYETCCLAEIHLPNIESKTELKKVAKYLYKICKHSLALPCHHEETEDIVHNNMRMGIGVTGYCMATKKQKGWLSEVYQYLRTLDVEYSKEMGWPESIKLTTVKPSGTLSLLSGVTPGAHPGFSHYYIRRIRMSSSSQLAKKCKENGYPIEPVKNFDGSHDHSTSVVSFPCKLPSHALVSKDCSAIKQLEIVKELQQNWSDNSVSVTVYYRKEELDDIKKWLKQNYNQNLKTVSFLLHSEHGFEQAPYEEITKKEYEKLKKQVTPITEVNVEENEIDEGEIGCSTGACPIK